MRFEDKIVLLRKEDCFLNATQIIKLASKGKSERQKILTIIKKATNVDVHPPSKSLPYPCSWVDFRHGRSLCKFLELEQVLQPLLNYGQRLRDLDRSTSAEQGYDYLKVIQSLSPVRRRSFNTQAEIAFPCGPCRSRARYGSEVRSESQRYPDSTRCRPECRSYTQDQNG